MDDPTILDNFMDGPGKDLLRLVNRHALVYILSDDGTTVYSNDKLAEISGYSIDELIGNPVSILRSEYHPQSFYDELWDQLHRGETWSGELCCTGRSGAYYWEELSMCALPHNEGERKYYLGVSSDITLVKNREQTMAAYNEMLINITKGVPLKENFDRLLENIEAIFPYMHCAIMMLEEGKYLRSVSGPRLPDHYAAAVDGIEIGENVGSCGAAAKTQKLVVVEDLYDHPNWAPYLDIIKATDYHACWSHPIVSSDGETYGTFAIYYKIPRAPNDIEIDLIGSLANSCRVAIESHRSRNELIEQKNRAEAANHAKNQFLANMSHELRTPLNAVIGFSEILQKGMFGPLGNEKYRDYAGDIQTSAKFLLEILGDILDISVIEAGQLTPLPETLPVTKLMGCCQQLVKGHAEKKGVVLSIIEAADEWYIWADKQHVKQILANLLINAIKFTPSSGDVRLFAHRHDDEFIDFSVEDTGIGISKENLEKVIEPFNQAADSMTRSHDGVGLGLSLAHNLAKAQGGSLSLKSELGVGTKVTVRLPIAR